MAVPTLEELNQEIAEAQPSMRPSRAITPERALESFHQSRHTTAIAE